MKEKKNICNSNLIKNLVCPITKEDLIYNKKKMSLLVKKVNLSILYNMVYQYCWKKKESYKFIPIA